MRRFRIILIMPGVKIFRGDIHYTQYYDAYDDMSKLIRECNCQGYIEYKDQKQWTTQEKWERVSQEQHAAWY